MGKASRRARQAERSKSPSVAAAPFVARPFAGLPGETDIVAMREIVPAALTTLRLRQDAPALVDAAGEAGVPEEITLVSVLPMAWPGLHRADGVYMIGLQSGSATGDHSRDIAHVLLALLAVPAGTPVRPTTVATAETPRLQDLVELDTPLEVDVRDSFDFWIAPDHELDADTKRSLEETDASIVPTTKMAGATSAYWCRVGERTHLRWILPHDEDRATDALARLITSGQEALGENTRLLGAFRACGLLAPVWDLDPALEAADYEDALTALVGRFDVALATDALLTPDERRARAGLLGRQLTLR